MPTAQTVATCWRRFEMHPDGFHYFHAGQFIVWNELDEASTLKRWFAHMQQVSSALEKGRSFSNLTVYWGAIMIILGFLKTVHPWARSNQFSQDTIMRSSLWNALMLQKGNHHETSLLWTKCWTLPMLRVSSPFWSFKGWYLPILCAMAQPYTHLDIQSCRNRVSLRCIMPYALQVKPAIYVTYNGDWFDWPFIETRAKKHNLDMHEEIGFKMVKNECLSRFAVHMDCLAWVNRDSYLPQGSRGLKVRS